MLGRMCAPVGTLGLAGLEASSSGLKR